MKRFICITSVSIFLCVSTLAAQPANSIRIDTKDAKDSISRFIYGQFSEHLGRCIYGGIWVGENSDIPNVRGIRTDIVQALRAINVPSVRWPGGCFADEYHWKNGIGPKDKRPKMVNSNWGGVVEDNSFGTHEFMDFCEQVGCEPVICGNIGSGTVDEMHDWVDYMTSDGDNPMANLRRQNGREKPWHVKYWCIGNETWGCGGIMSAEFYSNELGRYSWFLKNRGDNQLYKIASGGLEEDFHWTETIMKKWHDSGGWLQGFMNGYSLHYYTVCHNWEHKGSATDFNQHDWFLTMSKAMKIDTLIEEHSEIMDKYDPEKKIGLIVDEWGNWHDVEPGTNPGFLYQQNSLRDAVSAAVNLNIFNNHCDRVKLTSVAQMVNVLQAMILTKGKEMVLTPTYYVFKMYTVHQDALLLPIDVKCNGYSDGSNTIPAVSASASKDKNGTIHISLANVDPEHSQVVQCSIDGAAGSKLAGTIITAKKINAFNDFGKPEEVTIKPFQGAMMQKGMITVSMPARSIVTLEIQ